MVLRILFWRLHGEWLSGVWSNNQRDWVFLVANRIWIVVGILCLSANGNACPSLSIVWVLFLRWLLPPPWRYLFVWGWPVVCVPFMYCFHWSPYRPESFDGIVKNKLPGKLFFFFRSIRSSSVTNVRALYTGASQYIANRSDSSCFFVGFWVGGDLTRD